MMKYLHYFLSIRRTTIVALAFLFMALISTYAPVVAAQDGSVPPASDSTGGSIPQETSTIKDPTVTPDTGVPPADATGSGTATPVDPVRPAATSSSQAAPQDPAPTSPSNNTETPVPQAGNVTDNQISVSETQTTGTSSDTSANGWTPLFAGVGIGTLLGGIGVYRICRQGKDKKSKNERCERIAETLAGKKQALSVARSKFSIQEALMRELEKKFAAAKKELESLVKEAAKDAVVSLDKSGTTKAVVDTAERAKKVYDDVKKRVEEAREIYESMRSLLGQLSGEVDTLETAYHSCVLGAKSSGKVMAAGKKLVVPRVEKKQFVLFDFDGVIADSLNVAFEVQKKICPMLTIDQYRKRFEGNINHWEMAENFHSEDCRHDINFFDEYVPRMKKEVSIVPGMDEVIMELERRYQLVVISSTITSPIVEFLKSHKLESHFSLVMGNDVHKSKVEKIKMVFEKYHTTADACVFITDTLGDIMEAKEIDVRAIAVTWGFQKSEALAQGNPFRLVDTPKELRSAIADYFAG